YDLLSACVSLSRSGGRQIEGVLDDGIDTLNIKQKTSHARDVVTRADKLSQEVIEGGLRKAFRGIAVVGEEMGTVPFTPPRFSNHFEHTLEDMERDDFPMVEPHRIAVWIDPLDATWSFTKGVYEEVSVLIGVSVSGVPALGVIHFPFREGKPVYYGAAGIGVSQSIKDHWREAPQCPSVLGRPAIIATSTVCQDIKCNLPVELLNEYSGVRTGCTPTSTEESDPNSPTAVSQRVTLSASLHGAEYLRMGGAGAKMAAVILGHADAYSYPRHGLSKWDTLAGEAIICAMGGGAFNRYGAPVNYAQLDDTDVGDGIVAYRHESVGDAFRHILDEYREGIDKHV
ncbi:inositol monophosphatase, partial [Kipferlia bialata]